jgi:transposase
VTDWRIYLQCQRWRVQCPRCGGAHVEKLDWLAQNPRYTQRFALQVGRLCRDMSNKAVAERERLHHGTVKDLDKLHMQQQVTCAGLPAPRDIAIDEISIRKGAPLPGQCQRPGVGPHHLGRRGGPQGDRPRPFVRGGASHGDPHN